MIKSRILRHMLFLGLTLIFSIAMTPLKSLAQLELGPFEVGDLVVSDITISDDVEFLEEVYVCSGADDEIYVKPDNNRAIIYFPATDDGAVISERFPLIVFGHGMIQKCFRCPENSPDDNGEDFRRWSVILRHLASWGFIIISPDLSWLTTQSGTIGIEDRMYLLRDAVNYILAENSRTGSPFANRVRSTCIGAMGHSMGADAAILLGTSGEMGENIRVIAPIAPPNTSSMGSTDIRDFAPRPVILFQGTKDFWYAKAEEIYTAYDTAERAKHLVTIEGANHFGYTDDICDVTDHDGDLLRDDQQSIAKAYLAAFFRRYLTPGCVTELDVYLNGSQEFEGLESFDIEVVEQVTNGTDCACRRIRLLELDIKPGSCPNPLNVKIYNNHGKPKTGCVLPVAVLGTDAFNVGDIDVSTLLIEGVAPIRYDYEDVAAPVVDGEECECTTAEPDGYMDLTLKFQKSDIGVPLVLVPNGEVIPLTLTGELLDGTPFEATDCVIIRNKNPNMDVPFTLVTDEVVLGPAVPNPFNPTTTIYFNLPESAHVRLEVFNTTGQRVATLVNRHVEAGMHSHVWEPSNLSSGVYFYRMQTKDFSETKKVVLLK